MILLLLRILMVLLIALLLARFLGFTSAKANEEKYTRHIIILDDTPSMGDTSKGADNKTTEALEQAKNAIAKIAKELSTQSTPHTWKSFGSRSRRSQGQYRTVEQRLSPGI